MRTMQRATPIGDDAMSETLSDDLRWTGAEMRRNKDRASLQKSDQDKQIRGLRWAGAEMQGNKDRASLQKSDRDKQIRGSMSLGWRIQRGQKIQ